MRTIAGLPCHVVEAAHATALVVLLHGREMSATDLAPFGAALGLPLHFVFPQGPHAAPGGGRSWWPVDAARRLGEYADGPHDLHCYTPQGLAEARDCLHGLMGDLRQGYPGQPVILGGFSQGGMLACDLVLQGGEDVDALVLMSASRICFEQWRPLLGRVAGLPVFICHGRQDEELSFEAGLALRDALQHGGAVVDWLAFDGPHGLPLVVWRRLKAFLGRVGAATGAGAR